MTTEKDSLLLACRISGLLLMVLLASGCQLAPTGAPAPTPTASSPRLADLPPGWSKIEPGGQTRCAHNTPYAYWVRPGTSNRVFIYFQGGGGCSTAETCGLTGSYKDTVSERDNPAYTIGGVFNLSHPDNPFRDDTMLFIPYCTGDVHFGNRLRSYSLASGRSFDIHHRGYVNAEAALNWLYGNMPQPDSIFVTGCSAGGVGALLHAPHLIRHYPDTPVTQLSDSAGGLVLHIPWDIGADYHSEQYFPAWIPGMQDQIAHAFTIPAYFQAVAAHYPTYTFAQYNAATDQTQQRYFVADGGAADDYEAALRDSLAHTHQAALNFQSYTVPGSHHCALKYTRFYTEEYNGLRLRDWVAGLATQTR